MKVITPSPEHEVAYQEVISLMARHAPKVTAEQLLAIGANMLGKMIAAQDQRAMTPDKAMQIVALNIEEGNRQALDEIHRTKGSA